MAEAAGDGRGRLRELLAELTETDGVSGQEDAVRQAMGRHLAPLGTLERDGLGSLCCIRRGGAASPRVMLAAHMDEIGFVVRDITDGGFLRLQAVGGWWEQVVLAQRVTVHGRRRPVPGIVGSKPPHVLPADERKKPVEFRDIFVDVGAAGRAEAEEWGIRPGDPVAPVCPFTDLGGRLWMGKALDDRSGCAVLVEVMRRLVEGAPHPNTVLAAATVQEEVGLRGADVAARHWRPDIALAIDVGIAGDTPGIRPDESRAELGKGPLVLGYDSSLIPNPRLRDLVADTATEEGIPIQWEVMGGGGTDAGRMQFAGDGVPALAIGFPTRYIHSAAAVVHPDDMESAVRLVLAVLRRLDAATAAAIRA